MKLYLKNTSSSFKNILKYTLNLQNVNIKLRSLYIKYDSVHNETVRTVYNYLLKYYKVKTIVKTITYNTELPQISMNYTFHSNTITLNGTIINNGGGNITNCGFYIYNVVNTNHTTEVVNPSISVCALNSDNTFTTTVHAEGSNIGEGGIFVYVMNFQAFATNNYGSVYTEFQTFNFSVPICLVENTQITLFDGSKKYIQDITYNDLLLVWDFDNGKFSSARPLWIKTPEITTQYSLVIFDNGTELKIVNEHRIFNKESNEFRFPVLENNDLTTFTEKEEYAKVSKINVVRENVKYYNIITNCHINLFANGILTSCRYNNIYPIKNMTFMKDDKHILNTNNALLYKILPKKYIYGMRLNEQSIDQCATIKYVNRLITLEQGNNTLFSNKKILFLDHTGVLLNKNNSNLEFDTSNVHYIQLITNNFNLDIVISSDWSEFMSFDELKELYKKYNLKIPIDYTHKKKYNTIFTNFINDELIIQNRANEIYDWMKNNNYDVKDTIIIDDLELTNFFPSNNFIFVKNGVGISNIL